VATPQTTVSSSTTPLDAESFTRLFHAIAANVEQVILGKAPAIELAMVCLLAEGHLLLEDVPGVGKTSLAKAIAASLDTPWGRVQFTPDLLPSDVVGVTIWNRAGGQFDFRPGPVFTGILLGDEINRASPKTQSALLEAMEERQVTVDGTSYPLPSPFMVIATQNPIDHEGTYPLPESQLDRFLLRLDLGYPDRDAEVAMLDTHGGDGTLPELRPVASTTDVRAMVAAVKAVHVAPALKGYLVDLAEASRRHPSVALGMSPRATLALQRAARARAAASGRAYVVPDDIKGLAAPVLAHRLLLTPESQLRGADGAAVVAELLRSVPVPSGRAAG
jgi:MoxR-like ATPase